MRWRAGAVGLALLGLAACGGSGGDTSAEVDAEAPAEGAAAPVEPGGVAQVEPGAAAREIIFTADLLLRVDDVDAAVAAATAEVEERGGFVESSDVSGREDRRAALTLRVPPDELDGLVAALGELGRLEASSQSAEDVTLQVVDIESRIASAEATIARLRELVAEAVGLEQVVLLESELAAREADLESLQAQLRVIREQVDLSTVTVQLVGPEAPIQVDPDIPGFGSGLSNGLAALTNVLKALLAAAGFFLPFLVVFGLLFFGVRQLWRLYRRRVPARPRPPRPSPPAGPVYGPYGYQWTPPAVSGPGPPSDPGAPPAPVLPAGPGTAPGPGAGGVTPQPPGSSPPA